MGNGSERGRVPNVADGQAMCNGEIHNVFASRGVALGAPHTVPSIKVPANDVPGARRFPEKVFQSVHGVMFIIARLYVCGCDV